MMSLMPRLSVLALILPLTACGLADTATTAAVGAKTKADEMQQAKVLQEKVRSQLEQENQQVQERANATAAAAEGESR